MGQRFFGHPVYSCVRTYGCIREQNENNQELNEDL